MQDQLKDAAGRALQRPPVAHLVRAQIRYSSRLGNHFAASITYFTVLAGVPMIAFSFSVLSVVLTRVRPDLFDAIKDLVINALGSTGGSHKLADVIDTSVRTTGSWWTLFTTILVTLWAGVSWIGHIRSGILAQWAPSFNMVSQDENFIIAKARDAMSFITVLVVLLVTFATAQAGSAMSGVLGRRLGLDLLPGHAVYVTIVGLVVSTLAGTLFFIFLFGVLPRSRRNWSAILRGSLAAGVCLAVVQTGAGIVVRAVSGNRAVQAFGSIIIVMLVLNMLARMILFVAAWIATADQPAVAYHWNDADALLENSGHDWTVEGHWEAAHAERDAKEAEKASAKGEGAHTVPRPAADEETDVETGEQQAAARPTAGPSAQHPVDGTAPVRPAGRSTVRRAGWRGFALGAGVTGLLTAAAVRLRRR